MPDSTYAKDQGFHNLMEGGTAVVQSHGYIFDTSLLAWVAATGTYAGGGNITVNNFLGQDQPVLALYQDGATKYICRAAPGTSLSSSLFQVMKYNGSTGRVQFAGGSKAYVNPATDLATVKALSYS